MVFSSLLFVFLFLSSNLIIYFLIAPRYRNQVLLAFSLLFYAWGGPKYLILLLFMVLCSWFCAIQLERANRASLKKQWLVITCVILLGLLAFFKYTQFFLGNLHFIFGFPEEVPEIVLPIGISFYTFQLLSYVVDVYRNEIPAQKKYWKLLLYTSLFHQCIAGPIVRYQTVADEIDERHITPGDVSYGIRRFSVGLAKKTLLANSCASIADTLLPAGISNLQASSTAGLWLGMFCYALQIYLDFSAYSDMAIGMGRMVGFHYLENFNYPYMASSIQDFWRRWHISLSTFFRDYVYIPLGGSRVSEGKIIRNMLIVWALTGFWHGASWNFILWGLYFFVFLVLERYFLRDKLKQLPNVVGHVYALFVVFFGWVLFRFDNFGELLTVLGGLFGIGTSGFSNLNTGILFQNNIFLLLICIIAVTPLGRSIRQLSFKAAYRANRIPYVMHIMDTITPALLLLLSTMALVGDSYNPFLYFRF